jgi:hypothetical protein
MDFAQTGIAVLGALSIYLGYRLFCDLAGQRARLPVLLTNLVSGALLALFGLGILIAGVRGIHPQSRHAHPDWQKKSSAARTITAPERRI